MDVKLKLLLLNYKPCVWPNGFNNYQCQGTKVARNESSTYGTFVPGNKSSLVRKFYESDFLVP